MGFNYNEINFLLRRPDTIEFIYDKNMPLIIGVVHILEHLKTNLVNEYIENILNEK